MISRSELKAVQDRRVTIWDNLATLQSRPHVDLGRGRLGGRWGGMEEHLRKGAYKCKDSYRLSFTLLSQTDGETTQNLDTLSK